MWTFARGCRDQASFERPGVLGAVPSAQTGPVPVVEQIAPLALTEVAPNAKALRIARPPRPRFIMRFMFSLSDRSQKMQRGIPYASAILFPSLNATPSTNRSGSALVFSMSASKASAIAFTFS